MAKKAERASLYNKGRRTWPLLDGEKNVEVKPGKSVELDKVLADKMIKNYPGDFILGNKPELKSDPKIKALNKKIEDLTAENEALKKEIEDLMASKEEVVIKEAE